MQVSPQEQEFGDIRESTPESEEAFRKFAEEGKIVARGPREELKLLQDDLRKLNYRHTK